MSDNKIIELYRKGLSRKLIAKTLGISEWKVRCAIRQQHTKAIKAKEFKTNDSIRLNKVSVSKNQNLRKALILSDIHVPYHDQAALAVALAYAKDYGPDIIVLNGDIIDFYGASSYRQDPIRIDTLQDELTEGKALLKKIRDEHPNAEIYYIEGNHETRLKRFLLDKAPALACLSCLSFDELIGLKEHEIKFIDYGQSIQLGDLEVTHGEIVRKGAGMSAKAHSDKSGASILIGHCFDEKTEILTNEGWKNYNQITDTEIVATYNRVLDKLEYQKIDKLYIYSNYSELYHLKSRDIDLMVTDKHGLWATKSGSNKWFETTAEDAATKSRLSYKAGAIHNECKLNENDSFINLIAWIMAEGHFEKQNGKISQIRIAQSDAPDGRLERLKSDIANCGIKYSCTKRYNAGSIEHGQYRNYDAYRINLHDPKGDVRAKIFNYLDENKTPTRLLANMSSSQLESFLTTYIWADGTFNKASKNSYQVASNRQDHIDFLQEISARLGYRTSTSHNNGMRYLTINTRNLVQADKSHWTKVKYSGHVWCVSVPNGTLLVRRGGHTIITLNTHRIGNICRTNKWGTHVSIENGHLGRNDFEYVNNPDWQHGFTQVEFFDDGRFFARSHIINNGSLVVDGTLYETK